MEALDRAGYTTISGEALVDHVARGAKLPRKPILLTFDDASAGQYTHALPVLREHDFVATFFVMTVVLGKPGLADARAGPRARPRGHDDRRAHLRPQGRPGVRRRRLATQLDAPGRDLRRLLRHPVRLFAYPFGAYSAAPSRTCGAPATAPPSSSRSRFDRRHPLWNLRRIIVPELSGRELLREIRRDF